MKALLAAIAPLPVWGVLVQCSSAQLFGPEQVITSATGTLAVSTSDLDGDGDQDLLSSSAWFENTDGLGTFGAPQVLTTSADYPLAASDLDGDGDQDVIAWSLFGGVVWHENTDGLGGFGPQQTITTKTASLALASDLDGDGDQDVVAGQFGIDWYENTNGLGAFGPEQDVTTIGFFSESALASDVDGDGDQDLFAVSSVDDMVVWFENTDGLGSFGPQQFITTAANPSYVHVADLDGDGDQDLVAAISVTPFGVEHTIAWYENLDGLGSFGPQQIVSSSADSAFPADLDRDGDQDLLAASLTNTIEWYENLDGLGTFGPQQVITTTGLLGPSATAADLDSDGNQDVLSASIFDAEVVWYENLTPQAIVVPYGCGINPAGSLSVLSGIPAPGTTITLGIDNPLGTQGMPSIPILALSTLADPAFPCGTPIPGLGMAGPGAAGELLVSLAFPNPLDLLSGPFWTGAGNPASVDLAIPASSGLLGLSVYLQGVLWDVFPAAQVPFGLTTGVELTLGV